MADEQVGNNSWMTMTPGSAVAGQLQNILAQKRLDAHQAMLDQLTQQDKQSQIADRDANTAYNKDRIASLAADREAQEQERRGSILSPGQSLVGSSLDYWKAHNPSMIDPGQPAQPQFDYEGQPDTPATGETFHGMPKQLENKAKLDAQLAARKRLESLGPHASPVEKWAAFREAYGAEPPAGLLDQEPKAKPWHEILDWKGNSTGNWAEEGTHIQPQPTNPPAALNTPILHNLNTPDPADPTKTITKSYWLKPGEQPSDKNEIKGGTATTLATPKNKLDPNTLYDAKAYAAYKGTLQNTGKNSAQTRASALQNWLLTVKPVEVQKDVSDILKNPTLAVMPADSLATNGILTGSPEHIEKVKAVLAVARGQ